MPKTSKTTRFSELLSSHEKEIYRYAYRMTGDPDDAKDLLQETFLRAFQAFPRLPRNANHRAWLYRITYRQALNLFRSRRTRATAPLEEAVELSDSNGHPEALSETRRLARTLAGLIRDLTARQRSALLLKKYEGLSYADVAGVLGTTEESARAHVYQAMKKIRNGLRPPAHCGQGAAGASAPLGKEANR
jgi:RNA polymerase sigma-70 factor (ECF subfamily)